MAYYLDTSALVKLCIPEPETAALRAWMGRSPGLLLSSDLTRTELMRAVRRARPEAASDARAVLDALALRRLDTGLFEDAGRLEPVGLRSLDALHLAAALSLADDLLGFVTYDGRLASAAKLLGIPVLAPGTSEM